MTTTTPPALTGRDIGAAARATGALLDRLLDAADLPFGEWTVLFTLAGTGPLDRDELVHRQASGLKVPEATARATLDGMVAAGLLTRVGDGGTHVEPTAAGTAVYRPIRAEIDRIAGDLYGDLPPDDLAATRRTLQEVTRRADALLAGAAAGAAG
jgi:DNA-binding MarR family transcriptional regulator